MSRMSLWPHKAVSIEARTERLVWVLAFAVLICLRMPGILIHGRFWGEEGWSFHNAWTMPWYDALTVTYGGYVSLIPNLAGLLARHLAPLDYAPYVSTTLALLIQVCPAILLATARDEWLAGRIRLVAALLLLATPPASEEVWLATTQAQVHLALCTALILALEVRSGAMELFRLTLLLLAAFTGPGSWLLVPFFAFRAANDRSWGRAVQACVLAAGAIVQLLFFFHMRPDRTFAGPRMQLLIFFVRHLLIPFLGHDRAVSIATPLHDAVVAANAPVWPMVLTVVAFGGLAIAIFWQKRGPAQWMFLAGGTLAVAGYSAALHGTRGAAFLLYVDAEDRYSFAPTVLFGLSLLAIASTRRGPLRVAASALVIWLILVGCHGYFARSGMRYATGPDWRSEVAAWRADPNHPLATWPPNWGLRLPPDAR